MSPGETAFSTVFGEAPDPPVPDVDGAAAVVDAIHSLLEEDPPEEGIRDPDGGPERQGDDAEPGEQGLGRFDLPPECPNPFQHQEREVVVGVVADRVTAGQDVPDDGGMTGRPLPRHEERRRNRVQVEKVQEEGGDLGVRPVVEREGHALLPRFPPADDREEEADAGQERRDGAGEEKGEQRERRRADVHEQEDRVQKERGEPRDMGRRQGTNVPPVPRLARRDPR